MDASSFVKTPPILTLTVNPALDVSTSTAHVTSEHKLRCSATRIDPGGGGINVARVIRRLGGTALSLYAAGGPTGEAFRQLIATEGLPTVMVPIRESTRQSFTVDETGTGKQFRFVLQGPEFTEAEWTACLDTLAASMPVGGYIVASGSLPPGVPDDFYARVARLARASGARCIVDASGPALTAALAEGVFLVKPSLRELEAHAGVTLDTPESQADAAAQARRRRFRRACGPDPRRGRSRPRLRERRYPL
ncbi:1-phosphofructokinase family hexose kinase [Cryobacterium breve]|uniref:1-phosphofructokinase family hexose kinase n=1 Tax=Cryobacterium breve TaxID=1259258 RepID=UPI00248D1A27|nr:1-phosphofructokinase family hexose kinase [Cryobacterium breve]